MSGDIYKIAKRAVNAYINTGNVPQYVAAQVDRDVTRWMEGKLREAKEAAWEEGAAAQAKCYGMDKDTGPNPYAATR